MIFFYFFANYTFKNIEMWILLEKQEKLYLSNDTKLELIR